MREEDPRFRNLERNIGIFVAVAVIGIIASTVLYGIQKNYFTPTYNLKFTVDRGTGFSKGMPVKLSGFRIGRITSIALNNQAMVDIEIEIDKKSRTWIRSDSVIKQVKEGLVGDNILEITVGSQGKPELKDNEIILYVKTKGLDELADEIAAAVKPVLIEVRDIISYINNPEGDLKKSIRNLELLTRNLDGTRQQADNLLLTADKQINHISAKTTDILDVTSRKIEKIDFTPTLDRVNSVIDKIDQKLPPMFDKADSALIDISKISRETRVLSETAFPKIPGLLSHAEDAILSADRLIHSIQNNWLFRDTSQPLGGAHIIPGDSNE